MNNIPPRNSRKRLATRQKISNAATRLFTEHGFENVTVDQIAEAADVGRVTIFNHFRRKEDMFFDRDEEARQHFRQAMRECEQDIAPIEWLRKLAHRWIADKVPYLEFSERSQPFFLTIEGSDTLKARARAIRDELVGLVAEAFADAIEERGSGPEVGLAAALQVTIWSTAYVEAHQLFNRSRSTQKAEAAFLAIIDRGAVGLRAAFADTRLG